MLSASPQLWESIRRADLLLADGMPIVWASKILGCALPERVAGSSLISSLSEGAAREGRSVYLLGGDPGTAEAAAGELVRRHPALRIAGTDCPPVGFEKDASNVARIAGQVGDARPDIVFVGLGCPKQERLIEQIRSAAPTAWYLGVGISFSYVCGAIRRPPTWMRKSGLEWVFRLAQEPKRLARRYIRNDIPFALRLGALLARTRIARVFGRPLAGPSLAPRAGSR